MSEHDMYRRGPVWLPVDTLRGYVAKAVNGLWVVASTREPYNYRMAIAWRQLDGRWTHDQEGLSALDFEPDWYGELPYWPPLPDGG